MPSSSDANILRKASLPAARELQTMTTRSPRDLSFIASGVEKREPQLIDVNVDLGALLDQVTGSLHSILAPLESATSTIKGLNDGGVNNLPSTVSLDNILDNITIQLHPTLIDLQSVNDLSGLVSGESSTVTDLVGQVQYQIAALLATVHTLTQITPQSDSMTQLLTIVLDLSSGSTDLYALSV